ncbi:MAG TPA: hypothetical protein VGN12_17200 [Pirellulales bacterium]|jgi:hypothetical protein
MNASHPRTALRPQFSLLHGLLLMSILGIVWWQAARWPITATQQVGPTYFLGGGGKPIYEVARIERPPTASEFARRGLVATGVIVGLCCVVFGFRRKAS